jgi:hypothetical protein
MTVIADATDQLVEHAVDLAAAPVANEVDRRCCAARATCHSPV